MFFFKQKTAYEMRISDWSSDVCSSDLSRPHRVDRIVLYNDGDRRDQVDRANIRTSALRDVNVGRAQRFLTGIGVEPAGRLFSGVQLESRIGMVVAERRQHVFEEVQKRVDRYKSVPAGSGRVVVPVLIDRVAQFADAIGRAPV